MAAIPDCPNVREKHCPRSQLIILGEDERCYKFHCRTCGLFWVVSKDRSKQQAREANRIRRIEQLSEAEREKMRRPKYFDMGVRA